MITKTLNFCESDFAGAAGSFMGWNDTLDTIEADVALSVMNLDRTDYGQIDMVSLNVVRAEIHLKDGRTITVQTRSIPGGETTWELVGTSEDEPEDTRTDAEAEADTTASGGMLLMKRLDRT